MAGVCVWLGAGWGGRCWGEWVTGLGLGLPILEEHGETWICVCVLASVVWVVWVVLGESGWGAWARVWEGGVCYVCVCCESGLSVLMAGPGICILC